MSSNLNTYRYIGQRIPRTDALSKALGTAKYTADLKTKNMLIGKALFSKYPHANIKKIDTSRAKLIPGVSAVITAKDLPGSKTYGVFAADKPVLAEDKVRYMGDPIAFVAAVNERTAIYALRMRIPEHPDGNSGNIRTRNRRHPDTLPANLIVK